MLSLCLVSLAGCQRSESSGAGESDSKDASGTTKVRLRLNWFPEAEHGGFYAAQTHGFYQAAGLDVEILPGGRSTPLAGELATGRVEFAVANADDVVLYRNKGADLVVVMAAAQHHPRCIMVREDSGVKSLKELKGLTLQVEDGQPYLEFLRKRGFLDGVREVPYNGTVGQTVADPKWGQQAYVYSEPLIAEQQGAKVTTLMVSELGFDPYSSVLVTTGEMIKQHPETVRKMVKASIEGWGKYIESPAQTNALILEQNREGVTPEALTYGVKLLGPMCRPEGFTSEQIGTMTAERWSTLVSQMEEIGLVKPAGNVPAETCYDLQFLPTLTETQAAKE